MVLGWTAATAIGGSATRWAELAIWDDPWRLMAVGATVLVVGLVAAIREVAASRAAGVGGGGTARCGWRSGDAGRGRDTSRRRRPNEVVTAARRAVAAASEAGT